MADEPRLLFVYGTLRRGAGHPMHDRLSRHARLLGTASTAGRLLDTGRYPAAVSAECDDDRIHGELFELDDPGDVWPWLDEYEGCLPGDAADSLFVRRVVRVQVDGGCTLHAWIYWFNRPVEGLARIDGGDYVSLLRVPFGHRRTAQACRSAPDAGPGEAWSQR